LGKRERRPLIDGCTFGADQPPCRRTTTRAGSCLVDVRQSVGALVAKQCTEPLTAGTARGPHKLQGKRPQPLEVAECVLGTALKVAEATARRRNKTRPERVLRVLRASVPMLMFCPHDASVAAASDRELPQR
jgi:hypothetical protein